MKKTTLMIDNYQKERSFSLIKKIMEQYVATLKILTSSSKHDDLFMKTTKNLIEEFNHEMSNFISDKNSTYELKVSTVNILKDALDFYWYNGRECLENYNENDFVNAQNLLSPSLKSFVRK